MKKKFYFFDSEALKNFHKRIFFSIITFIFLYLIAFYRIFDVMIINESINLINKKDQLVERGNIYDRNGYLLASSIKSYSLSVNPNNVRNKSELSRKLSSILQISKEDLFKSLNRNSNFVWLKKNITPLEHQKIIDLGEIALRTRHQAVEEIMRIYPYSNVVSHVVGYTNTDGKGLSGIERGLNKKLAKGENIYLSIDINLQQAVRNELSKTINKFSAESGIVIVSDINTGEILTMNNLPDFNPNDRKTFKKFNTFNRAVEGNYEMGSLFKPLTIAMGIDKKIISSEMLFDVSKPIKGIQDFHPYSGSLGVKDIIVKSSNIGTAKIAKKIGKKNQKEFFSKIGFNEKIEFEILEAAIPLGNKNNWGEVETMTIGFGHGFATTPLHLISAYSSLINKGKKNSITIIKNNKNKNYNIKVIKEETSLYFIKLLRSVVLETDYTGPRVNVEGYEVGGKTGTSELINQYGKYEKDKNLTSFIGVFPVSKPKYLILAMIENPKKIEEENFSITGATVAAPLVKNIILNIVKIFGVPQPINQEILKADTSMNYYQMNNATF